MSTLTATLITLSFTVLGVVNVFLVGRTWDLNKRVRHLEMRIGHLENRER